ncbi:MAG: hypothetical protein N2445_02150 [Acidobacteria bacterium]|nr:hypothetical protein [Acidobacteriota bacterium]
MIKGNLAAKGEKEWKPFMDELIKKKSKKLYQKRARLFISAVIFVAGIFALMNLKPSKHQYLFASIPLKNSQTIVVEKGSVVEISENNFVVTAGVSK